MYGPVDSAIVYSDYYNEEVIRMWHIMERFWTDWNTESEIAEFFGHQRSRLNMASIRGMLARVFLYGREKESVRCHRGGICDGRQGGTVGI